VRPTAVAGHVSVQPGDVLSQAMIGPPVAGHVDLLIGDSHVLWRPDDPEDFAAVVGFGVVARTLREERRFREVVMVSPDRSSVLVMPRVTSIADGISVRTFTGTVVERDVERVTADGAWASFGPWLTAVFVAASTRSECIVVEMNTPEYVDEPYALAAVLTEAQPPIVRLECSPRPDRASLWPPGDVPEGQTISAPLDAGTLDVAGPMIADAVRTWAESPHDVAVTFCSIDQRPLVLER
jgi:hypothetical protein